MLILSLKAALVAVLIVILVEDLKNYRIRNVNVLISLALTISILAISKNAAALIHNALMVAVLFPFLVLAYARRAMGGGDAKLIAVALLWAGPEMSLLFALALFGFILTYWVAVKCGWAPFQRIAGQIKVPFGPSIAGAWIVTIAASAVG